MSGKEFMYIALAVIVALFVWGILQPQLAKIGI